MKKMLSLLVSGLLIICIAGLASASNTVLTPDDVTINPDGESVSSVGASIRINTQGNYHVTLTMTDGLSAYLESSSPIAVGSSGNWASSVASLSSPSFTSNAGTYTGKLYIKGTKPGTVTVTTYSESSGDSITQSYSVYSAETVNVSVPEFPTVALPVAALLGIVFIFGRKKEGM
ncbi:PEF-CTERM sorting domain-containing protein [Methanosarcina sp.]|uniref:PEF-CTERM sorting domain-containing protein n=1 Tax=Methanosarcina sp. TaxID=2213 RepID=UPI002ABCAEB4|nr:PEF-CTERM sorting domain-containing protein [Methanosarcina sp.]MDY9926295.1 PEF-CTERM sorting domain-containing protein [Methanosarcina sp.]